MMLMFGANGNPTAYFLCGKHQGRIGMLMGPSTYIKPRSWMPFACDNDRFIAFQSGLAWDQGSWLGMLEKIKGSGFKPRFVAVPDVVMDAKATSEQWHQFAPLVDKFKFEKAFVVQNGHSPKDVPPDAAVVFVGGDTQFKYRTLPIWCSNFPRVHVGRVNEVWRLERLRDLGVESCDGSGWFRDTDEGRRIRQLEAWLEGKNTQPQLSL